MVLKTLKCSRVTIFVKQADGRGGQDVVIRFDILHYKLVLLTLLVELELLSGVDVGVLERKILVLECVRDWDGSVEVDRSLQYAVTNDAFLLLLHKVEVSSQPVVF